MRYQLPNRFRYKQRIANRFDAKGICAEGITLPDWDIFQHSTQLGQLRYSRSHHTAAFINAPRLEMAQRGGSAFV